MQQIDLDDLPPKVARMLAGMVDGEEVALIRGAAVVGCLRASIETPNPSPAPETDMAEVMEHFGAIIEDEF